MCFKIFIQVFIKYKQNVIMPLPKDLMGVLACPKCKGDIKEKDMFIICDKCKLAYPILDEDVPDMLIEDAWDLEKARKASFKHKLKL